MKKIFSMFNAALVVMLANTGCLFLGSVQKQPEVYDLPVQQEPVSSQTLHISSIRNLSGADRRAQIRKNGTEIRQTEDYLWLLPPPMLLERKLKERFSANETQEKVPVLHTILRYFEFDLDKDEAFFGVNYEIVMPDHRRFTVTGNYRTKVKDEQYAEAMNEAIHRSMDDLENALKKYDGAKK